MLRESLARAGAPWEGPVAVHASPERGWRMRASLHFAAGRGRSAAGPAAGGDAAGGGRRGVPPALGAHEPGRAGAARRGRGAPGALAPPARPRPPGVARRERARRVARDRALARTRRPRSPSLAGASPGLDGFGVGTGRRLQWLHGAPFVEANVLGVDLRAHARSFFQANRFLLEPLARTVVGLVPAGEGRVIDLYAGVGLFALPARGPRRGGRPRRGAGGVGGRGRPVGAPAAMAWRGSGS